MSAIAQDLDAARAAGIRVRRLQVYRVRHQRRDRRLGRLRRRRPSCPSPPTAAIIYVLNGFIAAVIGGLGSNTGALIGGPLVGVASMYAAYQYRRRIPERRVAGAADRRADAAAAGIVRADRGAEV